MADGIQYNFGDVFLGAMQAQQEYNLKKQQYEEALKQQNVENVYRALNLQRQQEATAAQIQHNLNIEKQGETKIQQEAANRQQIEADKLRTFASQEKAKYVDLSTLSPTEQKALKGSAKVGAELDKSIGTPIFGGDTKSMYIPKEALDQYNKRIGQSQGWTRIAQEKEKSKGKVDKEVIKSKLSLASALGKAEAYRNEGETDNKIKQRANVHGALEPFIEKSGLKQTVADIFNWQKNGYSSQQEAIDAVLNNPDATDDDKENLDYIFKAYNY